jgi:HK97 family phage major capsid protein
MEKDTKGGFKCFGEYLSRVRQACVDGIQDSRLKTAGHMAVADDAQGGFLCPEEWADGIFSIVLEKGIVRSRAKVLPMSSDSLKIRRLVESSRASTYFGGISFSWAKEAQDKSLTVSTPTVGELELTAHKLIGSTFVSNELMADYSTFGTFMRLAFGEALAFEEDYHFIWGTGVGQPLGIMGAPATIQHARTTNAGTPVIGDLAEMAERLLPGSWPSAVWMMNPNVIGGLSQDATTGSNVGGILDLSGMECMGRPIILTEKCAGAGATGDVILADWNHYVIGHRSLEISASRDVQDARGSDGFITDETFWRVVLRVAGQPVMDAPVTPKLGTDTLSAFVVLTTVS